MAATLEIHFFTLKYTHSQFCQNYPKKVAKIKLILAKLAFATNYEVWLIAKIGLNYLLDDLEEDYIIEKVKILKKIIDVIIIITIYNPFIF
jgi:hypothetical protein